MSNVGSGGRVRPPRLKNLADRLKTANPYSAKPLPPKPYDPFVHSQQQRRWSQEVIRRAGGVCQWPGCFRKEPTMYADHIKERSDGGDPFDVLNGQCLCGSHHTLKTTQERRKRQAR